MKLFFRAKNEKGEEVTGEREAADKFALARDLRAEGLTVIYAEPADKKKKSNFWQIDLFGRIRMKDKIVFASNLSAMISAGLSLSRSLEVMERQTSNKRFKKIIHDIAERVDRGETLSSSLSNYPKVFPEVFVAMVATAEESGKLPEALKSVSEQLTKSYDLRRKVKGAMIYPSVIVSVMIIIGVLMMIFLVPTLTATFRELNVDLPLSTRVLIGVSDFMAGNVILVILFGIALVGGLISLWRSKQGRAWLDTISLRLPMIGDLTRQVNSATIMRTISSLISSGVSMIRTIEITERVVQNHHYKAVMKEAAEKVQKGITLSAVFEAHQNLFPVFVEEVSAVGEETGKLPDMLLKGAIFYEEEVDQVTKNLSTIIEPVLMVIIGVAVGIFAISIIGPMYSLSDAI
ncbi:MAG TPA: type II secretion system F family protein [Candidatus Paceibacterota bacterium]|nr:type II secretion system F family protein [Candidatus Paceibacterota bacterium]